MAENSEGKFGVYVDVKPKVNETEFKNDINLQIKGIKITPDINPDGFKVNIEKAIEKMGTFKVPVELQIVGNASGGSNSKNSVNNIFDPKTVALQGQAIKTTINDINKELVNMGRNPADFSITTKNINGAIASYAALNKVTGETIEVRHKLNESGKDEDIFFSRMTVNAQKGQAALAAMEKSASTLSNKVSLYMQQNTALAKKAPQVYNEFQVLQKNLANIDLSKSDAHTELIRYGKQFQDLQGQAKALGAEVDSLGHRFVETFKTRMRSMFSVMLFSAAITTLTTLKKNVVDIDSALTQLKIITGSSDNVLADYFDKAADAAERYGNSITDIINSTETYARLGYSLDESLNLANITNQFANVAAIDEGEATTALTSIIKAYNKDAADAESITDKLVKVGQDFAISASEIGVALENSGSSLHVANTSLEESIALAAAGNASVQDASKVGNALKTLSAYIRGSKTDLEDLGESTDGVVQSTSKLEEKVKALTGGKVSLLEADGETYRSIYDVMVDISKVWDKMSDVNRASLLETIAGKRQANVVASIITNIDDLENAYSEATNATGTLSNATNIYLDSIQGRTDQFKAQFQEFSNYILNSGLVKFVVSGGTEVLKFFDTLIGRISIISGISIAAFSPLLKSLNQVGIAVSGIEGLSGVTSANALPLYAMQLEGLNERQIKLALSSQVLTDTQRQLITQYYLQSGLLQTLGVGQNQLALATTNRAAAEELAKDLGLELIPLEGEQVVLSGQVATGKLIEAINTSKLFEEEENEIYIKRILLGENEKLAASNVGLFKGIGAFLKTPLGIATAVVAAAAITIKVIDTVLEKTNKSTEELLDEFSETTQRLQEITSEIDEVSNQIKDLEDKKLNITDEEDISNLESQISLLKQRKELLEYEVKLSQKRTEIEARELINSTKDSSFYSGAGYDTEHAGKLTKFQSWNSFGGQYSAESFVNGLDDGSIKVHETELDNVLDSLKDIWDTYNQIASNDELIGTDAYKTAISQLEKVDNIITEITKKQSIMLDVQQYSQGSGKEAFYNSYSGLSYKLIESAVKSGKNITANDIKEQANQEGIYVYDQLKNGLEEYDITLEDYANVLNLAINKNADFADSFGNISDAVKDADDNTVNFKDSIESLDDYAKAVKALNSAFSEKKSDGKISYDTLSSVASSFSDIEGIESYVKELADENTTIERQNEILSDLTYAKIKNKMSDEEIIASGEDVIATLLRSNGVLNANEVAHDMVARAKGENANATQEVITEEAKEIASNYDVANSASWSAAKLIEDANAAGITKNALAELVVQQQILSNTKINVDDKISAIAAIGEAAGWSAQKLASLYSIESARGKGELLRQLQNPQSAAYQYYFGDIKASTFKPSTRVQFSSISGSSGGSGGSKNSKSKETPLDKFKDWFSRLFDWIEVKLERQADKIDRYVKKADRAAESKSYTYSNTQYEHAIEETKTQITNERKAKDKYKSTANKVLDKAVKKGVIKQSTADKIKENAKNGKLYISDYSGKTQEVVKDYLDYYNKSVEADKQISELLDKIIEYNQKIVDNIRQKYSDKDDATNAKIDLYEKQAQNAKTAADKNKILSNIIKQYSTIVTNDQKEIDAYNKIIKSNQKYIKKDNKDLYGSKYSSASKKTRKKVNDVINEAQKIAKKGKEKIPAKTLDKVADYVTKGYIKQSFYDACYAYNFAIDARDEAKAQKAIDKETAKIEKEALQVEQLENIENEHKENREKHKTISEHTKLNQSLREAQGKDLTEQDYNDLIAQNDDEKQLLEDEATAIRKQMNSWGQTSEAYKKAELRLKEIENELTQIDIDNEDIKKSLRDDVYWRTFERAAEAAKRLSDTLAGINDLLSDSMLFDSDGNSTAFGATHLALLTEQLNQSKKDVARIYDEIKNLDELYNQGYYPGEKGREEYLELRNEKINEALSSMSNSMSYINEMLEYQKTLEQNELNALLKVIDARKNALNAKKEYYDYDKTLKNKNKDIQSLQAQLSALEGVAGLEARAKRAQLQAQLAEAQEDLDDTIKQHEFNLSSQALDGLRDSLQEAFDDRWKDIHSDFGEIQKVLETSNTLSSAEIATLNELFTFLGGNPTLSNQILQEAGIESHASGTKSASGGLAWTQENHKGEIIVRKSDGAILTPLNRGDGVIPNNLTENLFKWGAISPADIFGNLTKSNLSGVNIIQPNSTINVHYDALMNVEGNVDSTVITDLNKFAEKFYKGSYEYTRQAIVRDARKVGVK